MHTNGSFKNVYDIIHDNEKKEVPYIRSENVGDFFISGNFEYISRKANKLLYKTHCNIDDILVARTGKIGGATIVEENLVGLNANQNVVNIRIVDKNYLPIFVTAFLNSKFGKSQFIRTSTGNVQPWLNLTLLRKIKIPKFNKNFEELVCSLVLKASANNDLSRKKYLEAENLLIAELGLENFNPSSEKISIKTIKESFLKSGRLDSEYYQPKYDRLFEKLLDNNCDKLSNLVTIKKSIEPGSENYHTKGIPFIRVQDLTKFGLTDTSVYLSENEFKDCIRPKKDTILLSKDGTVGIAYKMNKDEDFITSSAILHLNVKDERVLPDYLTLVLNSIVVKMQAEKDTGGSIINHWKKNEIENVIIPIISEEKQEKISKLLIESEKLRVKNKSILEKVVKSVEMAIEYGEEKAIVYLNA